MNFETSKCTSGNFSKGNTMPLSMGKSGAPIAAPSKAAAGFANTPTATKPKTEGNRAVNKEHKKELQKQKRVFALLMFPGREYQQQY